MNPEDPSEIDPQELMEELEERDKERTEELVKDKARLKLNTTVAISVALLATFIGICKVKDSNLILEMSHWQAQSIDNWNFYQARNIRAAVYQSTADGFTIDSQTTSSPAAKALYARKATDYKKQVDDQNKSKAKQKDVATKSDEMYEKVKTHHDLFDFEEGLLSIAVSLLAVTSLTQKRWLFGVALVPTVFGVIMGLAGLFNLRL